MLSIHMLCQQLTSLVIVLPTVYAGVIRVGSDVSIDPNDLNAIQNLPRIVQALDLPLPDDNFDRSAPRSTKKSSDATGSLPDVTRGEVNIDPRILARRTTGSPRTVRPRPTSRPRPRPTARPRATPKPRPRRPKKPAFDGPLPDGGVLNLPKTGPLFAHILPGIEHNDGVDVLGIKGGKLLGFRNGVFRTLTGASNVPLGPLGTGEFGPRSGGGILGCGGVFGGGSGVNFAPFGSYGKQFTIDLRGLQIPALQRLC